MQRENRKETNTQIIEFTRYLVLWVPKPYLIPNEIPGKEGLAWGHPT